MQSVHFYGVRLVTSNQWLCTVLVACAHTQWIWWKLTLQKWQDGNKKSKGGVVSVSETRRPVAENPVLYVIWTVLSDTYTFSLTPKCVWLLYKVKWSARCCLYAPWPLTSLFSRLQIQHCLDSLFYVLQVVFVFFVLSSDKPVFANDTEQKILEIGNEEIILNCTARANPPSEYTWNVTPGMDKNELDLSSPSLSVSQPGNYTCTASNRQGMAKKLFVVKRKREYRRLLLSSDIRSIHLFCMHANCSMELSLQFGHGNVCLDRFIFMHLI